MKKLILLFALVSSTICFSQIVQTNKDERFSKDKNGNSILLSTTTYTVLMQPEWGDIMLDFNASKVYYDMLADNSGLTAAFTNCINDGKAGNATPQQLQKILLMFTFTQTQKDELNAILRKNFFAIQLE